MGPRLTQSEIKRQTARSAKAAQRLQTLGMPVLVTDDAGRVHRVKLTKLPWKLGSGHWIASAEQFRGYDCNRIEPDLEAMEAAKKVEEVAA